MKIQNVLLISNFQNFYQIQIILINNYFMKINMFQSKAKKYSEDHFRKYPADYFLYLSSNRQKSYMDAFFEKMTTEKEVESEDSLKKYKNQILDVIKNVNDVILPKVEKIIEKSKTKENIIKIKNIINKNIINIFNEK